MLDQLQIQIAAAPIPCQEAAASVASLYFDLLNSAGQKGTLDAVLREREAELVALDVALGEIAGGGTEQISLAHFMVECCEGATDWVSRLHEIHRIRFGTESPGHLAIAIAHTRQLTRNPEGFKRIRHQFL